MFSFLYLSLLLRNYFLVNSFLSLFYAQLIFNAPSIKNGASHLERVDSSQSRHTTVQLGAMAGVSRTNMEEIVVSLTTRHYPLHILFIRSLFLLSYNLSFFLISFIIFIFLFNFVYFLFLLITFIYFPSFFLFLFLFIWFSRHSFLDSFFIFFISFFYFYTFSSLNYFFFSFFILFILLLFFFTPFFFHFLPLRWGL